MKHEDKKRPTYLFVHLIIAYGWSRETPVFVKKIFRKVVFRAPRFRLPKVSGRDPLPVFVAFRSGLPASNRATHLEVRRDLLLAFSVMHSGTILTTS